MRQQLLALSLTAISGIAGAQVTITSADQPSILQVYQQARDTTGTQSAGGAGTGQTYSYGSLLNQQQDSLTFTNPTWTPYGSSYPTSNLSIIINTGDAYLYAEMNSTSMQIVGQAVDPTGNGIVPLMFSNPETQMIFPAAYGSSFADTAGGVNLFYLGVDPGIGFVIDSVRVHTWIWKTSDFDATGTLTSPLGTFNVLRQNTLRKQIDTLDFYAFGGWNNNAFEQVDSNRVYSYWTNGIGFPIVELTDGQDLGQITDATWLIANPAVTGIPVNNNDNLIIAYPNPVSDVLTIESSVENGNIEIMDMTGRVVKTALINSTTTRIDLSDVAAGMYTYRVVGTTQQGKVQVAH